MKKFRDILETVYPPKPGDEKNFADKHIVDKKDYPNAAPGQFTSDKKKAKRVADYDEGDDKKVYEAAAVHTKRADKEAVIVRAVDPKTGESKARVVKRSTGEIKIGEETNLDEKAVNPYAVGMAAAMKQAGDTPPLKKSTIVKGHEIAKSIKKEAMDPVGKHDADIDNDGDTDKSDKYLIKRRKAIGAALKKEDVNQIDELSKKTLGSYVGKAASRAASDAAKYGMDTGSEKGLKHFNKAYDRLNNVKKAAAKLAKEEIELDEVSDQKLDTYRQKAFADQPAGDDGSDKYRKRKFGRDLAFAKQTGRAKVLATKEEVELDELSQDTLNSYHSKAGADRLKAKATVQKTMDMKKPAASTVDKATSAFSRFQKRGKGMTAAANKMSEETDLDEAFKVGAMHLEDGSSITLTREDVDMLNGLFNQLNSSNKSKMEQRLKSSKNGFNEIITFAKEVV